MPKPYGLIVSNKNKAGVIQRPSIFDEDSDSDVESKPTGLKTTLKRQDRVVQEKAVEEDPTVFQYDEIYDEMDKKRKESLLARKDIDKKPKYINRLLAAADKRKKENERRIERQVQKEREAEGEEFKDKESFVTSAYRKKLEEMKALEEEEKREEYLESIGDVKRQGNLDGFYRHLYDQKVNYEDKSEIKETNTQENTAEFFNASSKRKLDTETEVKDESKTHVKERKYRKRENSASDSEKSDGENIKKEHLPSNLDADSDFSIDSESDSENDDQKGKDITAINSEENTNLLKAENPNENKENGTIIKEETKSVENDEVKEKIEEKKPKIDIWKKRTVGEVFDAALQRYFERKSLRESG